MLAWDRRVETGYTGWDQYGVARQRASGDLGPGRQGAAKQAAVATTTPVVAQLLSLSPPDSSLLPHLRKRHIPHNKYRQLCNTARGITWGEAPAKMVLTTDDDDDDDDDDTKGDQREFDENSWRV